MQTRKTQRTTEGQGRQILGDEQFDEQSQASRL
jgi:hypothetical protein